MRRHEEMKYRAPNKLRRPECPDGSSSPLARGFFKIGILSTAVVSTMRPWPKKIPLAETTVYVSNKIKNKIKRAHTHTHTTHTTHHTHHTHTTHTHTTHTHTHTHTQTRTHTHTHHTTPHHTTHTHHTHHTHRHTDTQTQTQTLTLTQTQTQTQTHTHTHARTHARTHTHTHTNIVSEVHHGIIVNSIIATRVPRLVKRMYIFMNTCRHPTHHIKTNSCCGINNSCLRSC